MVENQDNKRKEIETAKVSTDSEANENKNKDSLMTMSKLEPLESRSGQDGKVDKIDSKKVLVQPEKVSMPSIRKQLEFYFSEGNLRRDKFLRERLEAAKDDMIDINILLTFNRIKEYLGLPKDVPNASLKTAENRLILADSVRTSETVKVSQDNFRMGLMTKVDLNYQKHDFDAKRTIFIEGFPHDCKFEEVRKAVISVYDESKIDYIKLRRVPENGKNPRTCVNSPQNKSQPQQRCKHIFRGDVFVEFKPCNELDLPLLLKEAQSIRCRDQHIRSAKPLSKWLENTRNRRLKVEDKKESKKRNRPESESEPEYPYLALLTGIEGLVDREDIKDALNADKSVWVAYNRGDSEAIIRFLTDENVDSGVGTFLENIEKFKAKVLEKKKEKENKASDTMDPTSLNEKAEPLKEPSPKLVARDNNNASNSHSNEECVHKEETKSIDKSKKDENELQHESGTVGVCIKRLHGKDLQKYSIMLKNSFKSNSKGRNKRGKKRSFGGSRGHAWSKKQRN